MNEKATIEISAISFISMQTEIKDYIDKEVTGLCRAAIQNVEPKYIWQAEGLVEMFDWLIEQYPDKENLDDLAEDLLIDLQNEIQCAKDYLSVRGVRETKCHFLS